MNQSVYEVRPFFNLFLGEKLLYILVDNYSVTGLFFLHFGFAQKMIYNMIFSVVVVFIHFFIYSIYI